MSDARRRILLLGATGLVGGHVIAAAQQEGRIALLGLSRREIGFAPGTRMELVLADSEDWAEIVGMIAPDAVICALGTTRRKAGGNAAFRRVDHDLVLDAARAARAAGAQGFVHVSSVNADAGSRNFYIRTKGEVERELRALKFRRLDIVRPGLLRGARQDDPRPLESLGKAIAPLADLLLHGGKRKYRSIHGSDVAKAALNLSLEKAAGTFVHEHDALLRHAHAFDREAHRAAPPPMERAA